ncbi:hypothetical protein N7489_008015 [Penicillium chrysogenum]|uniref:Uncharacterized protein n=1 Tax=Penicillium chrysogenum TaxID=5076 RepID=A0ABQ8WAI2_PENCH|nr:uncharacterized protein N7489_008015 [Penicillium chrysogenum]KAJ5237924.1 hypothetical protein N7489_008015 [Penicillium chrysogenum]KAJ5261818.1 hypothetical protein N7505_008685 [Penicillium chrysogenum]KAJ5278225.1 hypothetical protein N7524_004378 [Penicillium chrysogenum]KAJ6159745.1 hypothetical protein N7497_004282 [Penicillium chrysogenum]
MPKYAFTTIKSTIDKRMVGCYSIRSCSIRTLLGNNQDPEFFIEWEKADQARRKEAAQNGAHIRRSPPTAAAYKAHQVEQARVDPNAIGGLYRTVIWSQQGPQVDVGEAY